MKEQWLSKLENYLTDALKGIIHVPYRIICTYHDKILSVTLINQTSGKSYLIGKAAQKPGYAGDPGPGMEPCFPKPGSG